MLDKYESITAGGDNTRPNPLMWTNVTRSDQKFQDRKNELLSEIRPLHEEQAGQFEEMEQEDLWDGFREYQEERELSQEEVREAIELSAREW